MKLKETFTSRAEAEKKAAELRKTYIRVMVFPVGGPSAKGGPYGVSYNPIKKNIKKKGK